MSSSIAITAATYTTFIVLRLHKRASASEPGATQFFNPLQGKQKGSITIEYPTPLCRCRMISLISRAQYSKTLSSNKVAVRSYNGVLSMPHGNHQTQFHVIMTRSTLRRRNKFYPPPTIAKHHSFATPSLSLACAPPPSSKSQTVH